ncbi:LRP1-like protein [Mya arenaria]|uniref:LRP1-like protein n=1 Tax=Mya arenaria TaxID=6604 RepID=A0ABY7E5H4_MYAAR|nr:LRP1-like protein [Mya arenaria]
MATMVERRCGWRSATWNSTRDGDNRVTGPRGQHGRAFLQVEALFLQYEDEGAPAKENPGKEDYFHKSPYCTHPRVPIERSAMAYIKIFTCFRTILVFLHVIYVSSGYPRAARLFDSPGVLWLENLEGEMCFRHVPITTNTWALSAFPEQPVTVAKGRHGAHNFTHMHVDSDNQTLVTTDPRTKTIIAVTFSEMGLSTFWTLYEGISHRVNGIAVDWTTDVVYWTDAAYDVILGVSMEKPNMAEVIVDTELDEPFSIVVYPQKGYMYWTDADVQRPRLMQATLGGRHIKTMVYLHRRRPLALTIDYSTERLYILCEDATGQQAVTFVETDGRLEQTITETTNAVGIARQLVIMSADSLELFHVERKKKGLRLPVKGTPSSVLVLDSARQPYRSNSEIRPH